MLTQKKIPRFTLGMTLRRLVIPNKVRDLGQTEPTNPWVLFPARSGRLEAPDIADSDGEPLTVEIFQKGNRVLAAGADKVAK